MIQNIPTDDHLIVCDGPDDLQQPLSVGANLDSDMVQIDKGAVARCSTHPGFTAAARSNLFQEMDGYKSGVRARVNHGT